MLFSAAFCNLPFMPSLPARAADLGSSLKFQADDASFEFSLPQGWAPATAPDQERSAPSHLIAVSGVQSGGGGASVRAVVEGGSRGRKYGTKLSDLGSLSETADRLVLDELLKDDEAKDAAVISKEMTSFKGSSYYNIRYAVGSKVSAHLCVHRFLSPLLSSAVLHPVRHSLPSQNWPSSKTGSTTSRSKLEKWRPPPSSISRVR